MSWIEPIFDRTQADVDFANVNRENPTPNKGMRTSSDLNRISGNYRHVRDLLVSMGYSVPEMTSRGDWPIVTPDNYWMLPTKDVFLRESDIAKFKTDITALRKTAPPTSPTVPDLPYLHYEKLNNIEKITFDIWQSIQWQQEISYNAGAWYAYSGAGWYFGESKTIPLPDYPVIVTETLPLGMVGDFYEVQIETISTSLLGVEFEIAQGQLPAGLMLSDDGIISGRPLLTTVQDFTIKATNISGSASRDFRIEIKIIDTSLRAASLFAYSGVEWYFGGTYGQ